VLSKNRKRTAYPMRAAASDLSDVIQRFIRDGWVAEPALVGLPSYSRSDLDLESADISGDLSDHHLLAWERNFPSNLRSICTEFKLYFYGDHLRTNGLSVIGQFRLTTLLKYLKSQNDRLVLPISIYMNKERSEGALMFESGVLIQFSADADNNNFYVRTVESGIDLTAGDASKFANERFVKSLFNEFSCAELRKKKGAPTMKSVQKLCDFLKERVD